MSSAGFCEEEKIVTQEESFKGETEMFMEFYKNGPMVIHEGHVWRTVLLKHHHACPCTANQHE